MYGIHVRFEILLRVLLVPQHSSSLFPHGSEWQSKKGRALRALGKPRKTRFWFRTSWGSASHFDNGFQFDDSHASRRIPTSAACTTFLDFSLMHGRSAPEALRAYLECNSAQAAVLSCAVEVARAIANHTGNWGISVRTIGEGI